MNARAEIAISVLAHELELANAHIEEDEQFLRNFIALAPFAHPDELPPFPRFQRLKKAVPVKKASRGTPYPRPRAVD